MPLASLSFDFFQFSNVSHVYVYKDHLKTKILFSSFKENHLNLSSLIHSRKSPLYEVKKISSYLLPRWIVNFDAWCFQIFNSLDLFCILKLFGIILWLFIINFKWMNGTVFIWSDRCLKFDDQFSRIQDFWNVNSNGH